MRLWKPAVSDSEAARLKSLYEKLGSLEAVAESEQVRTSWLGHVLARHDRRSSEKGDYDGPERRSGREGLQLRP